MTNPGSTAQQPIDSPSADEHGPKRPQGRVLRVKDGYNPNSSSVGSAIPTFLALAAASGALTVALTHMLSAVGRALRKSKEAGAPLGELPAEPDREHADEEAPGEN